MSETFTEAKQLSADEIRAEIDMRVGHRLIEKEMLRNEYWRGITDCVYAIFILMMFSYCIYTFYFQAEE